MYIFHSLCQSSDDDVHCKDAVAKKRNKYSQKRNCVASGPIFTCMCLWAIYILPRWVCLFSCRKICGPILGINRSLTDTWLWKLLLGPRNSFSGNTLMEFALQCVIFIIPHQPDPSPALWLVGVWFFFGIISQWEARDPPGAELWWSRPGPQKCRWERDQCGFCVSCSASPCKKLKYQD
jgi:hypothetical protein